MASIPSKNNKYKTLFNTTFLYAVSSFSSKLLSFFIRPFVTNVLQDPEVVGVTNLTTQCANLLIPIVSIGVANALIRFGLDKSNDKKEVFTNALLTIFMGFMVLLLLSPIVALIPAVSHYIVYLYIYVLTSCLRTLCSHFIRARMQTTLVAVDGILCTLATLGFYVLFLIVIPLQATGYLLAIICADLLSACFIFFTQKLWQFIDFKKINTALWRRMLAFSVPMIPAQISFWVINTSDLFFVQVLCDGRGGASGDYWVGLLSTGYFLPLILTTLGTVFYEAWQLSAITEESSRRAFFNQIFKTYSGVLFCVAAGVIWLCQPMTNIFRAEFYDSWQFVPFLTIAAMFTCFNQFYNSIYVVYSRTMGCFVTMFIGAITNCAMNLFFIQWWGPLGAALASMLSLMLVFVLRVYHTSEMLPIELSPLRMMLSLILLLVQAATLLLALPYQTVITTAITAVIILLHLGAIWSMAQLLLPKISGKFGAKLSSRFSGQK